MVLDKNTKSVQKRNFNPIFLLFFKKNVSFNFIDDLATSFLTNIFQNLKN